MPRIATVGKSELHASLIAASMSVNESNDCAVRAVAAVTGVDYATVHNMMAEQGRKNKRGTPWEILWDVLDQLGYAVRTVSPHHFISRYPGSHARVLRSVTTHHPDRFPAVWKDGKRYLFNTRAHVLAVVDGVNHDWTRGRAKRALRIWEVVQKTPATDADRELRAEIEMMTAYEM